MEGSESYIVFKNGEQYGSPFTSEKSLKACLKILQHFEPDALIVVKVFKTIFDRTYRIEPSMGVGGSVTES